MKKSLFLLLLLAGFSAYALNSKHSKATVKKQHKTTKKTAKRTLSPMADVLSFPFGA